jgi:molybdopterin-biosynthesis enzyme MoeA-like protein
VVGDVEDEIVATVNHLRERYDYLITTGGIGPTHDDITADAVAAHQSVVNVLDAARRAGLARITFAAQTPTRGR